MPKSDWNLETRWFETLIQQQERILNGRAVKIPGTRTIVYVHDPVELPAGPGHYAGGKFRTVSGALEYGKSIASPDYVYIVQIGSRYRVWIEEAKKPPKPKIKRPPKKRTPPKRKPPIPLGPVKK